MGNLRIGLDFDDLIANTSIAKADWISSNVSNWRELLANFRAQELMKSKIPAKVADKKAKGYSELHSTIPLWLTDRNNCIQIIGKKNYEEMSFEVYGPKTLDSPAVEGVKNGLGHLMDKQHELMIATSRRKEHLEFVEKWLEANKMRDWFSQIHSVRDQGSKVSFCVSMGMNVLIDDEIRFLMGNAPNFLKILVKPVFSYSSKIIIENNGEQKIVPARKIIVTEKIKYVPKFEPHVREVIGAAIF